MRINCNISAILANNQLGKSENKLSSAIEKLSSGKRINNPEDDAAGMAITKKMNRQLKGLDQAGRNSNDGISVVQTAEGSLAELENMVQRMRELAVQAADGSYSDEDRFAIQDEINQISQEIDRISSDTEFNTMPLLDGTLSRRTYSNVNEMTALSVSESVDAGKYSFTVTQAAQKAQNQIDISGITGINENQAGHVIINGADVSISAGDDKTTVYNKILEGCTRAGIDIMCTDGTGTEVSAANASSIIITNPEYGSLQELNIKIDNPQLAGLLGFNATEDTFITNGRDCKVTLGDGFSNTASVIADGNTFTVKDVNSFEMTVKLQDDGAASNVFSVTGDCTLNVTDIGLMSIQVGAIEGQRISIDIPRIDTETLGIENINCRTAYGASKAINKLDAAISKISAARSQLGAYQNRFESTVDNLNSYYENMTSALSSIEDCDMAEEMTEYTSQNVITQAATSVMAQANERPQTVLQLLR